MEGEKEEMMEEGEKGKGERRRRRRVGRKRE